MLENWCRRGNTLKLMSKDTSGETIPDTMIEKIIKKNKLFKAWFYARQLVLAQFDMALHGTIQYDDPVQLYSNISHEICTIRPLENTNMCASFGHLFSGYAASYYGYLWSEVYAADMFYTKFLNHELDPVIGMQYRKEILECGGSRDSIISLHNFLGREPKSDHFITSIFG